MISDTELFFMYLSAIFMSSLKKCLCKSLALMFLWRMVLLRIIEFFMRIPLNTQFLYQRDPKNCRAPFLRDNLLLTLRDGKKENKGSMFSTLNIATGYTDCYFKLPIVFCAIFDPPILVKGEVNNEKVLRALSFHQ